MKILLIESDESNASSMREALEARGIEVLSTPDGKEGLDLAHGKRPAAIVLAVELGDKLTGGYAYCNKLKKDEELRTIPLVLISSQATPETFEQHRKLKTRAEEYLIKPFSREDLVEKLALHLSIPAADIAVEDVEGDGLQVEEVDSFEIEGEGEAGTGDDDTLALDDAFAGLSAEASAPRQQASRKEPEEDEWALDALTEMPGAPAAMSAPVKVSAASAEPVRAPQAPGPARSSPRPLTLTPGPAAAEAALEIAELKGQVAELESKLETALRDLEEQRTEGGSQVRRIEAELARKDAAVKTAQARADVAQAQTRKLEATLAALKADTGRIATLEEEIGQLASERDQAEADRQSAEARRAGLETDLRERDTSLEAARRELADLRTRDDAETDRLRARITELETDASRNEERVLKAYQKIKGDERVKEKTKKALAIALQLLEEQALDEEARS